ncbi:MAG: hypothetical protein HYR62_00170 [Actinobacteria bacterium]|nr:hypothetical protein [Actinomycetota bacterium]MBI3687777.1 hypothetical protein [Actinomycetota bacterium]
MAETFRQRVEHHSRGLLVWIGSQPRWLSLVAVVALTVTGLVLRGPAGAAALGALAAGLGWLGYLSWPLLAPRDRVTRCVVVAVIMVAAVLRLRA